MYDQSSLGHCIHKRVVSSRGSLPRQEQRVRHTNTML